jgi:hypothetical protein
MQTADGGIQMANISRKGAEAQKFGTEFYFPPFAA